MQYVIVATVPEYSDGVRSWEDEDIDLVCRGLEELLVDAGSPVKLCPLSEVIAC